METHKHKLTGGCHCGALTFEVTLAKSPGAYTLRACDCGFCRRHGASYLSDPHGALLIRVVDERQLSRYRQGSGIAECLVCRNCGVLVGVVYSEEGRLFGAVNAKVFEDASFGETVPVSPRLLSAGEKTDRWKQVWFSDVAIQVAAA